MVIEPIGYASDGGAAVKPFTENYRILSEKCDLCRFRSSSFDKDVEQGIGDGCTTVRQAAKSIPKGGTTMRVMVIVKASKDSEAGVLPSQQLLTEMMKFNEELVNAGVMIAGEGLQASSKGKRVRFAGDKRTVIDGPFAETKELIAGFWLWNVKSMDEALEWVKRCPNPHNETGELEIRQVFEAEDFGAALSPELKEKEEKLRTRTPPKK
jgi:hypothetical protein